MIGYNPEPDGEFWLDFYLIDSITCFSDKQLLKNKNNKKGCYMKIL